MPYASLFHKRKRSCRDKVRAGREEEGEQMGRESGGVDLSLESKRRGA